MADDDAETLGIIFNFNFDSSGTGVAKGIDQHFASNAVDFIADDRVHRTGPAFNRDPKIDLLGRIFISYPQECLLDIQIVTISRTAEPLKRVTSVINHLSHYLQNMIQRCSHRQTIGQAINRNVELHGSADDPLEKGVMEFLRDSAPLGKSLFKAKRKLHAGPV
jgi:hypothetical protein